MTKHTITGTGTLNGLNIGKTWLLPPTLTLQYHFTDFGAFKPYIGVGINYTVFYNQSAGNTPLNGLTVTGLSVGNSFGAAAQVGFDYMLDRHWGLNFDVKKLFLEPNYTATVNSAIPVSGRANINPWLVAAASPTSSDAAGPGRARPGVAEYAIFYRKPRSGGPERGFSFGAGMRAASIRKAGFNPMD